MSKNSADKECITEIENSTGPCEQCTIGIFIRRVALDEFQICYEYYRFHDDSRS